MEDGDDNILFPGYLMFFKKFLSGGMVASFSVTLLAPLERAKLILQIQRMSTSIPKHKEYKGLIDVFIRIPKEQGFTAFWRGNTASIIRCFPYSALNFSFKDSFRRLLYGHIKPEGLFNRFLVNLLSGGLAGSCSLLIIYPLDFARTRLAMDSGHNRSTREYKNMRECLKDAYKSNGLRGIYRGVGITVFGVFLNRSTLFGVYDTGVDVIPYEIRNPWMHFLLAEVSSITASTVSYPVDTVRRIMMMNSGSKPKGKKLYKSSLECIKHVYQSDGFRGFYRGNMVNLIRGTGGSIMLIMYEYINVYILNDTGHHFIRKSESTAESADKESEARNKNNENFGEKCSQASIKDTICSF